MRKNKGVFVRMAAIGMFILSLFAFTVVQAAEQIEVQVGKKVVADLGGISAENPL